MNGDKQMFRHVKQVLIKVTVHIFPQRADHMADWQNDEQKQPINKMQKQKFSMNYWPIFKPRQNKFN